MKRYTYILLLAALAACSKGDDQASQDKGGYGSVSIVPRVETSAMMVETRADETLKYEIPAELIPAEEDLQLTIKGEYIDPANKELISYEKVFANVGEYATSNEGELPLLFSGDYTAILSDGSDITLEGEGKSCFGSQAVDFEVEKFIYDAEFLIDVRLLNSIFRLSCGEWFKSYFCAATFTVTTSAGSTFEFDPFDDASDDRIIFVEPNTELKISGVAYKRSGNQEVVFAQSKIGTSKSGYMNTIKIETSSVGALVVSVNLNQEIVEIHEENIELNPIE